MPRSFGPQQAEGSCTHDRLTYAPSAHAGSAGYKWPTLERRLAATTVSGRAITLVKPAKRTSPDPAVSGDDVSRRDPSSTFPAPLVLPGDELALDPCCPPQSLRAWRNLNCRNKVTPDRTTIYVCSPPVMDENTGYLHRWCQPKILGMNSGPVALPSAEDMVAYVAAFFDGSPVKMLPRDFWSFAAWDEPTEGGRASIGLAANGDVTRIRTRKSASDQSYTHQLNLSDILDALIGHVPEDAYAIVMLISHDMYEDEEDDFCCGRAYGGSRVSVVSSARDHPTLDESQGADRVHAWPASHCMHYVEELSGSSADAKDRAGEVSFETETAGDALQAAVAAHSALPLPKGSRSLANLLLSRTVRTVTHELGHCFGMEHCTYYACLMQSSSSIPEGVRQPPYLCAVCETKVLMALEEASVPSHTHQTEGRSAMQGLRGVRPDKTLLARKVERHRALLEVCEKWKGAHMFDALGAWLLVRINSED